ncbi:hypothetical protein QQP08_016324 [Theobroma cacao]|nr:hypothetical protein QQP08_016324 [Theobroma cacao]
MGCSLSNVKIVNDELDEPMTILASGLMAVISCQLQVDSVLGGMVCEQTEVLRVECGLFSWHTFAFETKVRVI